ncbi:3-mercaptopyruvate sulfurtransferase [Pararhodospirillum photometricum]|uniref:Sulfurtransferase n=1 Tax=Pararhodospirillum photometricum DSM 122 TaxID=1150469 RepID=H6SIJ0_PARPM|nr:3-mercaptopyruvate sulfurtransferase [Pararhodospirillum photometricum]CCG06756.1 3-mercaptopyruvate sulfurtransferase [Pararhodospirillum photometricum DSM 122]
MPQAVPALVSPAWLHAHLSAPDVRLIDASWAMPTSGRMCRAEYEAAHLPGAVFFDIDQVAAPAAPKPHTAPSPEIFAKACRALGLGNGQHLVIYDRSGGALAAARVWWMFRLFGHHEVSVLDGGLEAWQALGLPVDDRPVSPSERPFTARLDHTLVRDVRQVLAASRSAQEQIVDARSQERFQALVPEPWNSPRGGHIPGSLNLPHTLLMTGPHGGFAPPEVLRAVFTEAGVDLTRPLIASCGTGVTACVLALGAWLVGKKDVAVYDGSWFEWSRDAGLPVQP